MTTQAWECVQAALRCAAVALPRSTPAGSQVRHAPGVPGKQGGAAQLSLRVPFRALRQAAYREAVKIVAILIIINRFL